jgi:predicted permease
VQVLGSGSFVTTVILLQTVVITPLILTLVETADSPMKTPVGKSTTPPRHRLRDTLTLPLRNPIIIASALGATASATRVHIPADLGRSLALLGAAAVPTALVALGMSLHGRRTAAEASAVRPRTGTETGVVVALKTLLQPALAYLAGRFALHLTAHDLLAVVLCAGLPTAQNVFIYAREYELPAALPRDAVLFSTLTSMATLWSVVAMLGG